MRMFRRAIVATSLCFFLMPTIALGFDHVSKSGGKALSAFDRIHIAPVEIDISRNARGPAGKRDRGVSERTASRKAEDFHAALSRRLGQTRKLVDAPGPGVLTVSATLTRLQSSRPTRDDLAAQPGLSTETVYAGSAGMRVVFSEGGAALAEIVDLQTSSLGDGRARIAIWQDVDRAFALWSRRLAVFIDEN